MSRATRALHGLDTPEWLPEMVAAARAGGLSGDDPIRAFEELLACTTFRARCTRNALRREAPGTPPTHTVEVAAPDADPDRGCSYEVDGDRYLVWMPGRPHPLVLYAAEVKQLHRDYSSLGGNATINQLARARGLSRREAYGVIRAFGLTHDSLPFSPEELAERSEDELVRDGLALKAQRVERRLLRESHAEDAKLAEQWRTARHRIVEPIAEAARSLAERYTPPRIRVASTSRRRRWMLAVSPTDLHYGKGAWRAFGPGAYSRDICRERLMSAMETLLDDLADYGMPETILAPVGSDWFHIDGFSGTTSRGTRQDMDGVPEQVWEEGAALALDVFGLLRQVAPLKVVLQAGNHDELLSRALFTVVQQHFRGDDQVEFGRSRGPYEVVEYGANLIGVTHGQGLHKASDLGPRMATHFPAAWGRTKHRYWLTGNLHHYAVHSDAGVRVFLLPSLSGADRWHTEKGYDLVAPELMALGFDYEAGHRVSFHVPFELGEVVHGLDGGAVQPRG